MSAVQETSASTPMRRMSSALLGRRWPAFFTELVLIVVGILTALAIDGWVEQRKEHDTETAYLELLREDLVLIEGTLQQYVDFETVNARSAAAAYTAIRGDNLPADVGELQQVLAGLGVRRTLKIVSAAYTDLTSTGNLQLIREQGLREKIVRYFAETERAELVIEKNNTAFIDGTYFGFMINAGITPVVQASPEPLIQASNDLTRDLLGPDFIMPRDEILMRPPDAPSWDQIRRIVIFRMRIAAIGAILGNQVIESTRSLRAEIDDELARRSRQKRI